MHLTLLAVTLSFMYTHSACGMPQSGSNKLPLPSLSHNSSPTCFFLLFFFPLAHVELFHSLLASCAPQEFPPPCPPLHLFLFFFQTLICSSAPDSTPSSLPCTENLCVKLALRKAGPWPSQSPADLNGWMLVPGFHAGPRLRHLYLAPKSA
ncbi:hypothetical protein J3E68DRAFT_324467 [Trichoderma sp. SZMC 28012]